MLANAIALALFGEDAVEPSAEHRRWSEAFPTFALLWW
jgi:hypothetical protein